MQLPKLHTYVDMASTNHLIDTTLKLTIVGRNVGSPQKSPGNPSKDRRSDEQSKSLAMPVEVQGLRVTRFLPPSLGS